MTPMLLLADLYSKGSLHRAAYSAMPDAPVLPVTRRRRLGWLRRGDGSPARRPLPPTMSAQAAQGMHPAQPARRGCTPVH